MENIVNFGSFLNEKKIKFGTLDAFDKLTDPQQHIVLIALGMLRYNEHMTNDIELEKDGTAILSLGGKSGNWESEKDSEASKLLNRVIELIQGDKNLLALIEHKKGSRILKIKK